MTQPSTGTISIVSCGDSKFFRFLIKLEKNIRIFTDKNAFFYDLGLEDKQKTRLRSKILAASFFKDSLSHNSRGVIKTTHKPSCIRHFMATVGDDCLYMDADCLLVEKFDIDSLFNDCDIAVTYRHPRELKPHITNNGFINAGVIFFKNSPDMDDFLRTWEEQCALPETTDQLALSDLLARQVDLTRTFTIQKWNTLRVKVLPGKLYNDVTCRDGMIFHFKSAARRRNKYYSYNAFARILHAFPRFTSAVVRLNRKHQRWVKDE